MTKRGLLSRLYSWVEPRTISAIAQRIEGVVGASTQVFGQVEVASRRVHVRGEGVLELTRAS